MSRSGWWKQPVIWVLALAVFLPLLGAGVLLAAGLAFRVAGEAELAAVRRDLRERGEKLEMAEMAPPTVPDEENFFADAFWTTRAETKGGHPLFAEVDQAEAEELRARFPALAERFEPGGRFAAARKFLPKAGEGDPTPEEAAAIVVMLEPVRPVLDNIARLARRPHARYPLDYSRGITMQLPHISDLLGAGQILMLRARAELVLGRPNAALEDTLLILRLGRSVELEPTLISLLVRIALDLIGLGVVESGIPQWDEEGVRRLEAALSGIDPHAALLRALRGERAYACSAFAAIRDSSSNDAQALLQTKGFAKNGWSLPVLVGISAYAFAFLPGDEALVTRTYQEWVDHFEEQGGPPRQAGASMAKTRLEAIRASPFLRVRHTIALLTFPSVEGTFRRVAFWHTRLHQARAACAIQRFALALGRLPTTLEELVPDDLREIPLDPMDGRPLRYRLDEDGYLLWSVGWNETDEGGVAAEHRKLEENDWVWRGRFSDQREGR